MGYEIDNIEKVILRDLKTGEKIGELDTPIVAYTEENKTISKGKILATSPKDAACSMTIMRPPRPNTSMIISPGDQYGNCRTELRFYRAKHYNWFQRLMYKICFGITIKQGDEISREYI